MRRILLAALLFMLPSLALAQIQCLGPTCPIAFASSNISTGSANVQAISTTSGQFSLQTGNSINFVPGFSNSGAMTVNVDGTGAVAVHLNGAAVPANTLLVNQAAILIYDGVAFDVPSPQVGGTSALPSGDIWVGNGSGIATAVVPSGDLTMTNAGVFTIGANKVTLPDIAQIGTNTVLGNATSGTANVTALAVGSCSAAADALIWTTNTGFGCNTAVDAATLLTKTWASPAAIGTGTPAAGTFTTGTFNTSVTTPTVTTASGPLTLTSATTEVLLGGGASSSPSATSKVWIGSDITFSGTDHALAANAYFASGWKYVGNGSAAGLVLGVTSSVAAQLFYAANNVGGAGAALTNSTALAVSTAGNVSIGADAGAESLRVVPVASAVNRIEAYGAATGNAVELLANGSDPNVPLVVGTKGSGTIFFQTNAFGSAANQVEIIHTAGAANVLLLSGGASGANASINVSGNNLLLGSGSAVSTSATAGFPMIGTVAGTPTGAPTGNGAGAAAIIIDTTNHKICWNEGGTTWKCALGS